RSKISDIASQCGFQEMSYFARSFRQRYGSTPSQYRALQKQH
ncbi:MAG: helix-turn-helix domain-containing protein, partial [Firmicutes bacterium]|nr:helix-turn-helix domain-containing protein [Bacillota bacterium]